VDIFRIPTAIAAAQLSYFCKTVVLNNSGFNRMVHPSVSPVARNVSLASQGVDA